MVAVSGNAQVPVEPLNASAVNSAGRGPAPPGVALCLSHYKSDLPLGPLGRRKMVKHGGRKLVGPRIVDHVSTADCDQLGHRNRRRHLLQVSLRHVT